MMVINMKKKAITLLFLLLSAYIAWHLLKFLPNITWADFLNFKTVFLSIIIEALPFLLIGVLVSALLQNFFSEETIRKFLPGNRILNILLAGFLGIVFPVCECGIVPVARGLVSKGVPLYSAITFMLAAPIINPVVASSTAVAFGANPEMVWFRLGLAFFVSFAAGYLLSFWFDGREVKWGAAQDDFGCGCGHAHYDHHHHLPSAFTAKIFYTLHSASDEFFDMGKYLIIGSALAALAQTFVPRDIILNVGHHFLASIASMMTFAFGISVCSSADAFIAASFAGNFTAGSLLAFMVFGPMIDIKNILMMLNAFQARFVAVLIIIVSLLVAVSTYLINFAAVGGVK